MNLEHYQFKLRTNMLTVFFKYKNSVAKCAPVNFVLCLTNIIQDGLLTLLLEAFHEP